MKQTPALAILCILLGCLPLHADTVYYMTATGKNFVDIKWQAMDSWKFEKKQPEDVFDFYTFKRLPDGTTRVERHAYSFAGDWDMLIHYHYAKNGHLDSIDTDFLTFGGIETGTDQAISTRCLRTYTVTPAGKLHLVTERIEDVKTKRIVKRGFYQPVIDHWMTLDALPIKPKS